MNTFCAVLLSSALGHGHLSRAIEKVAGKELKAIIDKQVQLLVQSVDEKPNVNHRELTPSTYKLIELGDRAIGPVVELMLHGDRNKRLCAGHVLLSITQRKYGYKPGEGGWPSDAHEERWRTFWASLGNLDFRASEAERTKSVRLWKQWCENKQQIGP
jgi:hypothetical protein